MGSKRTPPVGRRFKKGQSGNPSGRPSHKDFKAWLDERRTGKDGKPGHTRRENVLEALYLLAINSRAKDQARAIELILAYDLGKPVQGLELTGKDGGPVETVSAVARLAQMTTGAMRRELEALQKRREAMLAGGKKPAKEEAPAPAPSDAAPSDSDAR